MDNFIYGWKDIEKYLGIKRRSIIALGYPVNRRGRGGYVMAKRDKLNAHSDQLLEKKLSAITCDTPRRKRKRVYKYLNFYISRRIIKWMRIYFHNRYLVIQTLEETESLFRKWKRLLFGFNKEVCCVH